jgi:hypothetical protein
MADHDMFSATAAAGGSATEGAPDQAILQYLRQTQPWVAFIAVVAALTTLLMGFAGAGIAVMALAAGGESDPDLGGLGGAMGGILGAVYLVFAAVYAIPTYFLARFALAAGPGDLRGAADAIRHQRNLWRALGGITLATIVLYCGGIAAIAVLGTALSSFFDPSSF